MNIERIDTKELSRQMKGILGRAPTKKQMESALLDAAKRKHEQGQEERIARRQEITERIKAEAKRMILDDDSFLDHPYLQPYINQVTYNIQSASLTALFQELQDAGEPRFDEWSMRYNIREAMRAGARSGTTSRNNVVTTEMRESDVDILRSLADEFLEGPATNEQANDNGTEDQTVQAEAS